MSETSARETSSVTELDASPVEDFDSDEGLHCQLIDAARKAVRAALREHKLMGNSIAVWRNGRVLLLSPEQIDV